MLLINPAGTHVPAAERTVVSSLGAAPGLVLVNILVRSSKRTREVDLLVCAPSGYAAVEVKPTSLVGDLHTDLNGAWTVNGVVADFAGGPNPLNQTRSAAAAAAGHLTRDLTHRIHVSAIVVVVGAVNVTPHRLGDTWVCSPDQLAGVLMRTKPAPIPISVAAQTVKIFGADPADVDLTLEGFTDSASMPSARKAESAETKDAQRRAHRRETMQDLAEELWRQSHSREVLACGLASAASLLYVSTVTLEAAGVGLFCVTAVAVWQLWTRRRLPGMRLSGFWACLVWFTTLLPYLGMGVALSVPWLLHTPHDSPIFVMQLNIAMLVALVLFLVTRVGRCGFIYPPYSVVERNDKHGNPSGLYALVSPTRRHRYDMHLIDPGDPRAAALVPEKNEPPKQIQP